MRLKAKITDLFCSLQGEGKFCGKRQIFVRFAGCNLNCDYCDESYNLHERETDAQELVSSILSLAARHRTKSISLTGGEPLLHAGFLEKILPVLKKRGFETMLETNAVLYREFNRIKGMIDTVSADIKLPSSAGRPFWKEHKRFFAATGGNYYVKIVVTGKTSLTEMETAFALLASVGKKSDVFIQPATPFLGVAQPKKRFFPALKGIGEKHGINYEILSQQHVQAGIK